MQLKMSWLEIVAEAVFLFMLVIFVCHREMDSRRWEWRSNSIRVIVETDLLSIMQSQSNQRPIIILFFFRI